jgi:hypothetical protein
MRQALSHRLAKPPPVTSFIHTRTYGALRAPSDGGEQESAGGEAESREGERRRRRGAVEGERRVREGGIEWPYAQPSLRRWQQRRAGGAAAGKSDGGRQRGREQIGRERAAARSRRGREMAVGRAELDGSAHGLPQHVEELGRHALLGRAVAGPHPLPPSHAPHRI